MATTVCGYCEKTTHLTVRTGGSVTVGSQRYSQGAFICDSCKRLSIAFVEIFHTDRVDAEQADDDISVLTADAEWFPRVGVSPLIVDVPDHIAHAAGEAYRCASIGASMSAILMARTVIEATAKAKGIASGNLLSKIDKLKDQNLIRPDIAAVAHVIRHFGNDMAHGDIGDRPDGADADDVLTLMKQVLDEVFTGPALLKRVSERLGI
jgi:hypothetical protein